MTYTPQFIITANLLAEVEQVAGLPQEDSQRLCESCLAARPAEDTRTRNVHASTAIEGNQLTLEQVRALEAGCDLTPADTRHKREVLNYFAGLRYVGKKRGKREYSP